MSPRSTLATPAPGHPVLAAARTTRETPPAPPERHTARENLGAATASGAAAVAGAATALRPLFTSWRFLPPTLAAVLLVAGCGWLARRWLGPGRRAAAVSVALAAGAVTEYLTLIDARSAALGGVMVGPGALTRLAAVAQTGLQEVRSFAVPVPSRPTLVLLAIIGVAAVAWAVDAFGVSLNHPAAAGLALLPLVVLAEQIHGSRPGLLPVLAGGAGWLGLLASRPTGRVASWGPHLGSRAAPEAAPRRSPGWRIAALALLLTLVIPVAAPRLNGRSLLRNGLGLGSGTGSNTLVVLQPLVTVATQLHDPRTVNLFTVHTDHPTYLRLTALDGFDGTNFTLTGLAASPAQRVDHPLPAPVPFPVSSRQVRLWVQVGSQFAEHYLPLPYAARDVSVSGDWRLDYRSWTVFSAHTDTLQARYHAVAYLPRPTVAELAAAGSYPGPPPEVPAALAVDTYLPPGSRFLAPLAREVIQAAGARTWVQAVVAIQDWLRGSAFHYSLDVPALQGPEALATFLLNTRTGYCEQFATAMAALARSIGLPARVVVGFTPGRPLGHHTYLVTDHDAHAWPEIYFPDTGWLRFEPTPLAGGRALLPAYTTAAPASSTPLGPRSTGHPGGGAGRPPAGNGTVLTPSRFRLRSGPGAAAPLDHGSVVRTAAGRPRPGGGATGAPPVAGSRHSRLTTTGAALLAVMLLGAASLPAVVTAGARRRGYTGRRRADPGRAWRQLLRDGSDLGVPLAAGISPRANAQQLRAVLAGREPAQLGWLLAAVELARYAPGPLAPGGARTGATGDPAGWAGTVRRELRRQSPRWRRLRATLAPPSAFVAACAPLRLLGRAASLPLVLLEVMPTRLINPLRRRAG